jgi:hypothetical protein
MRECRAEGGGRFPDGVVQISRAFADRAVKLGRNEARLALHERRIALPRFEEGLLVSLVQREHNHEHDGAPIYRDLPFNGEGRIEWAQQRQAAMQLQAPWIDGLSKGLAVKDIETAHRVIVALRQRLENNDAAESELGRQLGRVTD